MADIHENHQASSSPPSAEDTSRAAGMAEVRHPAEPTRGRAMTQTPQRTRATFLIRNQTPRRLEIIGLHNRLKLAPLEQIRVDYRPHEHLGPAAVHARADRAVAWEKEPARSTKVWATAWLTLIGIISVGAAVLVMLSNQRLWWPAVAAAVVAALCIVAAAVLNRPGDDADDDPLASTVGQRFSGWRFTKDVALSTLQKLALVVVLAVGILGPTAAIYYGSELSSILSVSGWQVVVSDEGSYPIVVARSLQIVLVVVLALIPGLMYFQFDREKLATLMDRWVHHAFRLDPTLHTLADVDAKFGRRVEEFYGASFDSGVATARKRTTTRSPLYIATVLLGLGWIVLLLNAPADLVVQSDSTVAGAAPDRDLPSILQFIQPAFTPMTAAFLGGYFFAVQVVLLGYVRGDLRPKTYTVVTVRIVVAVILAWTLEGLFGSSPWVLAAAFLGGIVPDTVLRQIRDFAAQVPVKVRRTVDQWRGHRSSETESVDEFKDRSPLIALDGIDIYERTRLAEEGITSIQALARHDLVDLMLSSRIPASRLVDWLDQALLYQHVTPADRQQLRKAGFRTATELLAACRNQNRAHLVEQLEDGKARLPVILGALRGDEWLTYVTHWRSHDDTREPGRIIYTDDGLQPAYEPAARNESQTSEPVLTSLPSIGEPADNGSGSDGEPQAR